MKTLDVLKQVSEDNTISEKHINLLKNRANRGEEIDFSLIWDNPPELTAEQNTKGIDFLLNLWKTPKGKERKNNPFGYREQEVLKEFKYFELAGFYDSSKYGGSTYLIPLYNVIGIEGSFQYYYDGKINIVG